MSASREDSVMRSYDAKKGKRLKMKYQVKYCNRLKQPYMYGDPNSELCETKSSVSYKTDSLELCKKIVKDFLDAPDAELSLEAICKDFGDRNLGLSERKAS